MINALIMIIHLMLQLLYEMTLAHTDIDIVMAEGGMRNFSQAFRTFSCACLLNISNTPDIVDQLRSKCLYLFIFAGGIYQFPHSPVLECHHPTCTGMYTHTHIGNVLPHSQVPCQKSDLGRQCDMLIN